MTEGTQGVVAQDAPVSARSALVAVNLNARGVTDALLAEVSRELEQVMADVSVCTASTPGAMADRVRATVAAALDDGQPIDVVCVGGDGTVREVAEAMARGLLAWPEGHAQAAARLFVVPAGSGNSVYRALWGDRGWTQSLRSSILGPYPRVGTIDLLRIRETDRATVLGVNTGLGARATAMLQDEPDVDDERRAQIVAASMADASPYPGRLKVDGATLYDGAITHVSVGGVRSFMGGRLELLPHAEIDDGLLDVCLIGDVDRETLAHIGMLIATGKHLEHPAIHYGRGITAVLERTDGHDMPFEHDGDVQPGRPRLTLDVVPAAVPVATARSDPDHPPGRSGGKRSGGARWRTS